MEALINIKGGLNDPHGVLNNWDEYSVDACSWTMITCSSDYLVIGLLVLSSLSLSLSLFLHFLSHFHFYFSLYAVERLANLSPELYLRLSKI